MALTNWSALNTNQLTTWSRDLWSQVRQNSFVMQLAGSGPNSMVQRITELSASQKGTQAYITLVQDMNTDGVMGDSLLWDNEEALVAAQQLIRVDQIRNAIRLSGKMADQKVVVRFRETARDQLAYWLADRLDQVFFLIASGQNLRFNTNGSIRTGFVAATATTYWSQIDRVGNTGFTRSAGTGQAFADLEFTADITAPSSQRWWRWVGSTTNSLVGMTDGTTNTGGRQLIANTDLPSYRMLVEMKAYAKDRRIRPLKINGMESYYVFMHPRAMAKLKLDADFLANIRNAGIRGDGNPLFSGAVATVDGLILVENTHVPSTIGATAGAAGTDANRIGYKWGTNGAVDGSSTLLMGAQAMAFADLGAPTWEEDTWDFKNQNAISCGKIIGLKKPVWVDKMSGTSQDYGVMRVDHAI
jgi:N4-gp56 family major capsid protein